MDRTIIFGCLLLFSLATQAPAADLPLQLKPLLQVVDLDVGEEMGVTLSDGSQARVKLVDLKEIRDDVCFAIRRAR